MASFLLLEHGSAWASACEQGCPFYSSRNRLPGRGGWEGPRDHPFTSPHPGGGHEVWCRLGRRDIKVRRTAATRRGGPAFSVQPEGQLPARAPSSPPAGTAQQETLSSYELGDHLLIMPPVHSSTHSFIHSTHRPRAHKTTAECTDKCLPSRHLDGRPSYPAC